MRSRLLHIPELDGLRGVAILLVFGFHYIGTSGIVGTISSMGWIGVDLFFALSGFLITRILLAGRDQPNYFRNFYARRSLRIFPLYFGVLVALFVITPLVVKSAPLQELSQKQGWLWCYSANIGIAVNGPEAFARGNFWTVHLWSLAVEEQFYLIWPIVVLTLSRNQLVMLCTAIVAASPLARAVATFGLEPITIYVLTPFRLDSLAAGALVAAGHWPAGKRTLVCGAGCLIVLAFARNGLSHLDVVVQLLGYSLLAVTFATAITLLTSPRPSNLPCRVLRTTPIRLIGKYSYGLYVFHCITLPFIEQTMGTARFVNWGIPFPAAGVIKVMIGFAINLVLAISSWHLFEKHFLNLKKSFEHKDLSDFQPSQHSAGLSGSPLQV